MVVRDSLCKISMNQLEDEQCRYDWIIKLEKEDMSKLSDSLVFDIKHIVNRFFHKFPGNIGKRNVNDPFIVDLYVSFFCDTSMSISERIQTFNFLTKRTSYDAILPHKKRIIQFFDTKYISLSSKAEMAALLRFSNEEINAFFSDDYELPLKVQGRFGDSDAVKALIKSFDSAHGYEEKEIAMKELLFTGQLNAIDHVITKCADSVFEMQGNCIATTLQYEFLKALSYYHPGEPILEQELSNAYSAAVIKNDSAAVRVYYERVYEWMYRKYKVRPEKEPPVLFFQQQCKY